MRIMLEIRFPNEPFNTYARKGEVGSMLGRALEAVSPEAVYFTETAGRRSVIVIADVADPSRIPSLAEPFFLGFDAEVHFKPVMSQDELGRAGLDDIGRQWSR